MRSGAPQTLFRSQRGPSASRPAFFLCHESPRKREMKSKSKLNVSRQMTNNQPRTIQTLRVSQVELEAQRAEIEKLHSKVETLQREKAEAQDSAHKWHRGHAPLGVFEGCCATGKKPFARQGGKARAAKPRARQLGVHQGFTIPKARMWSPSPRPRAINGTPHLPHHNKSSLGLICLGPPHKVQVLV